MAGICGILSNEVVPQLDDYLDSMLESMRHHAWHQVERPETGPSHCGFGRVSLGYVNNAPQPVALSEQSVSAVMDGELYQADALRRDLQNLGAKFSGESHAEILLHGYLRQGREFFQGLKGKFAAAIHDGNRNRLILVNDHFGMKPLYYAQQAGGSLVFASEIKALLLDPEIQRQPNERGIVQFFTFGHLWGEETFYSSVRALPARAWVEFDPTTNQVEVAQYCSLPTPGGASGNRAETLERLDGTFKQAVDQCADNTDHLGISLSGGLDARTILGVIDHQKTPLKAICMGMTGSHDMRSAREMARLAGCEYHDFELNSRFLSEFETHLNHMVHLTDGHYLSQCVVMPTLPYYREHGIQVLLRGHAGELMHMQKAYNFSLDRQAMQINTLPALNDWLYQHLRAYMLDAVDEPLFEFADNREIEDIARDTITTGLKESDSWQRPLDRIWQLFVTERLRRETAMSLVKFGSMVETRVPYLDNDLVKALISTPADMKQDETIQGYILGKRFPEFLKVSNVNTGARIGASKLTRQVQYAKMRIFAKLGVKGYQPYERLGLWLRRELVPLVRSVLLDDSCLDRGTFRPDTVKTVVNQHLSGSRNHTFLLMAMMIYELGCRKYSDSSAVSASQTGVAH